MVVMHNDAVVQGLSEVPHRADVPRWGVLTIGTGLGNARFTNREPGRPRTSRPAVSALRRSRAGAAAGQALGDALAQLVGQLDIDEAPGPAAQAQADAQTGGPGRASGGTPMTTVRKPRISEAR